MEATKMIRGSIICKSEKMRRKGLPCLLALPKDDGVTDIFSSFGKASLFSFIVFSFSFLSQGYAKIDPKTCVGMWLLDENEADVAKDLSGNGNNGRLVNNPKWVDGRFNSALEFDGVDDYVDCDNDVTLNPSDTITIQAWFKAVNLPSAYPRIVSKETNTTANPYSVMVRQGDSVVRFLLGDGTTEYGAGDVAITLGVWYHIAATYDGAMMRIYLNGTLAGTRDLIFTLPDRTTSVLIGNNPPNDRQFNGTIDEVAIFSVALDKEEIKKMMTKGVGRATGMSAIEPLSKLSTTWANLK